MTKFLILLRTSQLLLGGVTVLVYGWGAFLLVAAGLCLGAVGEIERQLSDSKRRKRSSSPDKSGSSELQTHLHRASNPWPSFSNGIVEPDGTLRRVRRDEEDRPGL